MKLNIGCGGVYKEGYINIDAFNKTIADKCMSAIDLRFPDNSIEQIDAYQLIEHLGFIEATYAVGEWFRVLRPNGVLKIETPDVETSFKIYNEGDEDAKKNIFPWIFGLETTGLQHKCVFPKVLLHDLLQKSGFTNIGEEFFEKVKYQPTVFLEQEKLIDTFRSKIIEFYKKKYFKILDGIVIESAIYDPRFTKIFLDTCVKKRVFPKNKIEKYLLIAEILKKLHFQSILFHILRESPGFIGEQERLFDIVHNFGRKSIKKLFSQTGKDEIMKSLIEIDTKIVPKQKIKLFSEKIVEFESNRLFQQGVKEFIIRNYEKSIEKFEESVKLFRNNILNYWNLARLLIIQNRIIEAKNYYKNALELSEKFPHPIKKQIQKSLNDEIEEIQFKKYTKPKTTLKL